MSSVPLRPVLTAFGRALRSQFSGRMLLLSALPFLLSVALWSGLLYTGLQPLLDAIQAYFAGHNGFQASAGYLGMLGLGVLKNVIVPLLAMLLLLPLMILTALLFMGVAAMPAIVRHVSARQYPALEQRHGGSFFGSLRTNLVGMLVFLPIWLLTLPLYPLSVLVQVVLWGWLTAHVMSYDALADHASDAERRELKRLHRTPLSVLLFPILAPLSIWIFVLIFVFTGLWFQYYCLQALGDLRAAARSV